MILVISSNGNQGRALVPKLSAAGMKVRALRNRPVTGAVEAQDNVEIMMGDATDRSSLEKALEGVKTVFHIAPTVHPQERSMGTGLVDLIRDIGGIHLVYSSVIHSVASRLPQHKAKRDVEEHIIESGIDFTILKPADYMMPGMLDGAFQTGTLDIPFYMVRPQAMVAIDDLSDVALKVIREREAHYGASYDLASEVVDPEIMRQVTEAVCGKTLVNRVKSADEYFDLFFPGTDPSDEPQRYAILRFIETWYATHDFPGNSNVLSWLLGRAPVSFKAFAENEFKRFSAQ